MATQEEKKAPQATSEGGNASDGASASSSETYENGRTDAPQTATSGSSAIGAGDFSQQLQEQIAQALKPVLADFRKQVTRTIEDQEELHQMADSGDDRLERETRQVPLSGPSTEGQQQQTGEESTSQGSVDGQSTPSNSDGQSTPTNASNGQSLVRSPGSGESSSTEGPAQEKGRVQEVVSHSVRPVLDAGLQLVERQAEQWLQTMLAAGLDALLTESTRTAVQQRAGRALHAGLQKAFDALPESATTKDLQAQTERTLQAILRESIDALFADAARASLQEHGKLASQEITHRNFTGALQHAQHALQALLQQVVAVLRRQWQRVLRLLLRLILTALQDSLAPGEKESLQDMSHEPAEKPAQTPDSSAEK